MNLPEYIRGMLEYKESLGYSRKTYESYLKDFQRYFMEAGHDAFTEEAVLPWCRKRDTETAGKLTYEPLQASIDSLK